MAEDRTLICASSELGEGAKGVRFDLDVAGKRWPAFLVRYDSKPRCWLNQCPHLGTELDWQPGEFFDESGLYLICATHGAVFMPDTGDCVGGPCKGQRLARVPVEERDAHIHLTQDFRKHGS